MTPEQETILKAEIASLKELLTERDRRYEERFQATAMALKLQSAETERRLKDLNNEAARIQQAQAVSVSRELYDATIAELRLAITEIKVSLSQDKGKSEGISTGLFAVVVAINLLISLGGITIALLR